MTTLDREWERIQERTFTKWTNSHLKKRGMEVENLTSSLQDGVKLINLYEIISDEPLSKYYKQPKMKIHSIANLSTVVDKINSFVSSVGIKVQFSAEQIYEGEKRQILGMIWCLIHKFEIQDISEDELSAKEGLLLWVQKKTKGYKDVDVQNFHYSFQDGLAFCALIHRHRPDLIDFDSLSAANKKENLELAFKVAEEKLDIPQLLDSQDMIDYKPDEKSVMTYVAYYWKKFASSQKNEKAANVIGKNVSRQRMLEQLQSDYERRATALLAWIGESKVNLSDTSNDHFGYSLEAVSEKNVAFKDFKNNQKPTQLAEKLDLEVLLANLRSQQKSAGLPIYTPPEELSTESINASWGELNDVQDTYEKVLKERIALMKRLEILVNRFRSRAERIKTWQSEKLAAFGAEDITKYDTVSALQARAKTQESFADEFASINNSLNDSKQIAQEVIDNQHATSGELQQTIADLEQAQQQVQETSESLLQRLQQALAELEAIINKCFEYARIAEQLSLFLEEGGLALGEAVRANTVADVEAYEAIVSKVQTDLENAQAQLDQLVTLNSEVQAAGHDVSNYSNKGVDSLQEKFNTIKDQLAGRQTEASSERERQEGNANLLKQFADQAAEYNNWTEEQKNAVNADVEGSLGDQLNALQAKQGTLAQESDEKLAALVQLYQQIEEADIAEQSNTGLQSLQVLNDQLKQVAAKRVEAINQAILAEKASNLSEEQLAEIANTFKHFDKDGNGTLSKIEFKAASASLGEDYTDEELERVYSSLDTNGNGGVSFSEFVSFFEKVKREGTGYEDVLAAFETLTGGQPVITEAQLRGSGMPAEEVDYLLSAMPAVEGGFDFKAYLATQYGK